MSDDCPLKRRTLLGATAAMGIASLGTVVAGEEELAPAESAQTVDLSAYANCVGRVSADGLDDAFDDWGNGDITDEELDAVIDAWSEGERVVDYEVRELDDIDEETTLERAPDGEPVVYQIDSYVGVDARLEIEPGVAIECTEGYGLYVDDGSLVAQGTEDEPILFTGTKPIRGWWDGVYVRSDAIENEMDHCIVEYGGNGYDANLDLSSDQFDSPGEMTLTNCTLRRSGKYGLTLWHSSTSSSLGSVLRDAENNTYSHNRMGPAQVRSENAHTLAGSSEMFDNDRSFVRVSGESMRADGTWDELDVPYRVVTRVQTRGYDWEVEAGTTIELEEDAQIDVGEESVITWQGQQRRETEDGFEEARVTFTGTQKQRGWWDGIRFASNRANNVVEWVTVEYGGDPDGEGANIRGSDAGLDFRNCQIRHSGGYGITIDNEDDELRETFGNVYENNADAPVRAYTGTVHQLDDSAEFIDNDESYVFVRAQRGAGSTDMGDVTWSGFDIPYRMEGGEEHNVGSGDWTIEPGATIECEEDVRIDIGSSVVVQWQGDPPDDTDEEPGEPEWVTFTATQQNRGWWHGINISGGSENNVLEYVTVEYGGDPDWYGANIRGASDAAWDFRNCRVRHSEEYGIKLTSGFGELRDTENNTYENNRTPVFVQVQDAHGLDGSSTYIDNDNSYVFVRERPGAGSITIGDFTWDGLDVPYRLKGDESYNVSDGTWTIEPGATLEMEESAFIEIGSDSSAVVDFVGTEDEPILFTGTDETRGRWDGIQVSSDSLSNTIEHATIEYGGRPSDFDDPDEDDANIDVSGRLSMTDCTIQESGWNGAYVDSAVDGDICTENTFEDNENQDCVVDD